MDFLKAQSSVDLGGDWQFAFGEACPEGVSTAEGLATAGLALRPCVVPGNFELDLQACGLIDEPFYAMNALELGKFERHHVWYSRRFTASVPKGTCPQLVFEGVDCCADIYLNGHLLGSQENALVEHVYDVAGLLKSENELLVHIKPALLEATKYPYPPMVGAMGYHVESLYMRKPPHAYGWDIMPRAVSAGLWRTVKLRFRPAERLEEVYLRTARVNVAEKKALLCLHYRTNLADATPGKYEIRVRAVCGDSVIEQNIPLIFPVGAYWLRPDNPRLWWPAGYGAADLYDVTVTLLRDGKTIDTMQFTHGIRWVELVRTSVTTREATGEFVFKVNGVKIFCKGSNHVSLDAFHSRDLRRTAQVVQMAKDANCNMLRCWGGNVYESDLFFDLCDRAGIMIWQDFMMACAIYPQDDAFAARLADEATKVVKRLRQHASLAMWAGDNECDIAWGWFHRGDPNRNVLTRRVLPDVLKQHDIDRAFLPSSPYMDEVAYKKGEEFIPENHLWGPRDYFKSEFYRDPLCLFASEIGYHGCPSVESVREFISPGSLWPCEGNREWILHSTNPSMDDQVVGGDYRVMLMVNQVKALFGELPGDLETFAFASQASQAEAKKFFIELFRATKWRRTGIIWWNLLDGWPQFSDAVVDYYFRKKLAYSFIQTSQQHLCLMLREAVGANQKLVAANDTQESLEIEYSLFDVDLGAGKPIATGKATAGANATTELCEIPFDPARQRFYVMTWQCKNRPVLSGKNHHLAGTVPFELAKYKAWLEKAGLAGK